MIREEETTHPSNSCGDLIGLDRIFKKSTKSFVP